MFAYKPGGPLQQLSTASFFLAALVSDLLLIRLFLVLAYVFLLIAAALGLPKWPFVSPVGGIAVDTTAWSCLCLAFHLLSFGRLVWDERHISFQSSDEEQLWRFFYRRSGMGRLEMKQVLKYGHWLQLPAGRTIVEGDGARLRFYLLVEGLVTISTTYRGLMEEPRLQYSGCCFDLGLLNSMGIFVGFEKDRSHLFAARTLTNCLLYTWTTEELSVMATRLAPAVPGFWRNFSLCQLGMYFTHRSHPATELMCATGEPEPESVLEGARSRDFTDALRPFEQQGTTVSGMACWLRRSFHPFPPAGLRHNALPITGVMARNRLKSLKSLAPEE